MFERRRPRPVRRKTSIRKQGSRAAPERRRDPTRHEQSGPSREVTNLLKRYGLRPQKGFGQNFLVAPFALETILDAAQLTPTDQIFEIGPGLGVLTRTLAERARRVVAIEIDAGIVAALRDQLADRPNLELVEGDALHVDPGALIGDGPYKVVANLPYYIASALLRRLFEAAHPPTRIVVMVQLEVAQRIVAAPGDLSPLGVSVQYYGQPRIVGRLPAAAFHPRPKVDSAILAVDVLPRPSVDVPPAQFFKVVTAGFAMPRKQLHNALPQKLWMPAGAAGEALAAAGIDPVRRAQTLSLPEWAALARALHQRGIV